VEGGPTARGGEAVRISGAAGTASFAEPPMWNDKHRVAHAGFFGLPGLGGGATTGVTEGMT
jgi:hypothetical protein